MVVDPSGKIVASTEEKPGVVYADVNIDRINEVRRGVPITVQRRFDAYADVSA